MVDDCLNGHYVRTKFHPIHDGQFCWFDLEWPLIHFLLLIILEAWMLHGTLLFQISSWRANSADNEFPYGTCMHAEQQIFMFFWCWWRRFQSTRISKHLSHDWPSEGIHPGYRIHCWTLCSLVIMAIASTLASQGTKGRKWTNVLIKLGQHCTSKAKAA